MEYHGIILPNISRIYASTYVCVCVCVHLYVQTDTHTLNNIMLQKVLDSVSRFLDCLHCGAAREMSDLESNSVTSLCLSFPIRKMMPIILTMS